MSLIGYGSDMVCPSVHGKATWLNNYEEKWYFFMNCYGHTLRDADSTLYIDIFLFICSIFWHCTLTCRPGLSQLIDISSKVYTHFFPFHNEQTFLILLYIINDCLILRGRHKVRHNVGKHAVITVAECNLHAMHLSLKPDTTAITGSNL